METEDCAYATCPEKVRLKYLGHAAEGRHDVCARAIAGTTAWRGALVARPHRGRLPKPRAFATRACSNCGTTFIIKLLRPINREHIRFPMTLKHVIDDIVRPRDRRRLLMAAGRYPRLWHLFTVLARWHGWPLDMEIISTLFLWSDHFMFKVHVIHFLALEQYRLDLYRLTSDQIAAILTCHVWDSPVKDLLSYYPCMPSASVLLDILNHYPERGYIIAEHVDSDTRTLLLDGLLTQKWRLPKSPVTGTRHIVLLARRLLNGRHLDEDCLKHLSIGTDDEFEHSMSLALLVWNIHRHVRVPSWIFGAPKCFTVYGTRLYKTLYARYLRLRTKRFMHALCITIVGGLRWHRTSINLTYTPGGPGYRRARERYYKRLTSGPECLDNA